MLVRDSLSTAFPVICVIISVLSCAEVDGVQEHPTNDNMLQDVIFLIRSDSEIKQIDSEIKQIDSDKVSNTKLDNTLQATKPDLAEKFIPTNYSRV